MPTIRSVDTLELLELESRTIWGRADDGLADNTIATTAISLDGRSMVIPGATRLSQKDTITTSISRCWQLKTFTTQWTLPAPLRLVTEPVQLEPPHGWTAEQWTKLMSGRHGPWAAIADDTHVVSLAHCARLTAQAAEVGVETNADQRGRGLASIAVNAWGNQLADQGLVMFYSADESNIASHRTASKCRAISLGCLVQIAVSAERGAFAQNQPPEHP